MQVGDLVHPSFESVIVATSSSMTDSKAQKEYNDIVNDLGIGIITNSSDYYGYKGTFILYYTVHWSKKGIDSELCTEEDLIVIQSVEERNK
jgi:hypothetical protein